MINNACGIESFSDLFARRRQLMDEWAAYLNGRHGTDDSPPR